MSEPQNVPDHLKIMIIDDDMDLVEFIKSVLELWRPKAVIETAYDSRTAWKKIQSFQPQLVVLDLKLPGVYGFELCAKICRSQELAGTKVLAVSSYDTPHVREKIKQAGTHHFLPKPFSREALIAGVEQVLKASPS